MGYLNCGTCVQFLVFMAVFTVPTCLGLTDPRDVFAINSFYAALGFPPLAGWVPMGGDPCGLGWQGVQCVNANITGINLNGANLAGRLTEDLSYFASILQIDLSDNHIGGPIPFNLPLTITTLYLYGNQFIGIIPVTISSLSLLADLSLAKNQLEGTIPDSFQQLKSLGAMDLSGNNLTGALPSSMGNLSSLTTLHLQDNQLTGTLDVLEDLPLRELYVENNLFSGPIPESMLAIPNFRKEGNPFNTSILPSPPVSTSSPSPVSDMIPALAPDVQATAPSPIKLPDARKEKNGKTSITWIAAMLGLLAVIVIGMGMCLFLSRCFRRRTVAEKIAKKHETYAYGCSRTDAKVDDSLQKPHYETLKVRKNMGKKYAEKLSEAKQENYGKTMNAFSEQKDHKINIAGLDPKVPPPLPAHFPLVSCERFSSDSVVNPRTSSKQAVKSLSSLQSFTIASLQQCTDSFSQENFVGKGMLGSVYKAKLHDGKLLAIKKLDPMVYRDQSDQEFLNLVSRLSTLQHPHVVKLVGRCLEHRQRLLVYEYCSNGTLHEALHVHDDIHFRLTWNARVNLALQAAKALEYLHEICQPPVVHKNFKSANILLDDDLSVRVSDCGFAPLLSSNSMTQLQACGYGAPELEVGSYTYKSDVYSFGVVMLELLTGRKSLDRSRPRAEQFLVRWAIPQLHDIDALSKMVDLSLNGAYPSKSLSRFADIISMCMQPEPEFRPPMSEIVQRLLCMVQKDS